MKTSYDPFMSNVLLVAEEFDVDFTEAVMIQQEMREVKNSLKLLIKRGLFESTHNASDAV